MTSSSPAWHQSNSRPIVWSSFAMEPSNDTDACATTVPIPASSVGPSDPPRDGPPGASGVIGPSGGCGAGVAYGPRAPPRASSGA